MACQYSYITNNVSNPVEADRLNNLHTSIMQDAVNSKLFKRKDKLYFSSLGTKKLKLQLDYVDDVNTTYNSEVLSKSDENTLKVNVLGLIQDVEPVEVEEVKPQIPESELNIRVLGYNEDNHKTIIEIVNSLPKLFEKVGLIITSNELKTINKTINNSKLNRIINKLDLSSTVLEINNKTIKGMFYEDMSDVLKDLGLPNKDNIIVLESGYDIETRLIHEGAHKHNDIIDIPEQSFTQEEMLALIDTLQKKAINETVVLDVKDYIIQSIKKGKTTEIIPNLYQLFKESPTEAKKIFSKELLFLLENDGMFLYDNTSKNLQSSYGYNYNELQIQKISKIPLNKDGLNNKYNINEEGEQTYLTKEGYVVVHVGYEDYTGIIDKVDIEDATNLPSISEFQQLIDYSDTVKIVNRLYENENNYEYLATEEAGYYQWKKDVEMAVKNYISKYDKTNKFYQLDKIRQQPITEAELVIKLKSFINTQGFEAKVIDELERSQEANGKTFTVNGFVDLTNKIIKYDEQSLPEEAFTLARAMFVPDDSTIYEQVRQHPLYEQVKKDYKGIYKEELDFAKETLDKLGAENLIRKANTVDNRLMTRLKRIWDKLMSWIKGNEELQTFLDEMTDAILNNKAVGNKNENVTGVFYQVDEIIFDTKEEELLYKGISSMKQRLAKLSEESGKGIGQKLREKIDLLEQDLEQQEAELGLVKMLRYFNEDSLAAINYINGVGTGKYKIDGKQIKYLGDFIEYYYPILVDLRKSINLGLIQDKGKKDIIQKELQRFDEVSDFYKDVKSKPIEEFLGIGVGEKTNTDVSMASYLFGSLRDVNDQVLRKVHAIVTKIIREAENVIYDIGKDLVAKFDGDFNTEKYREKVNGKKTHYFLTEYRLGEFYKEYDTFKNKLNEEFGITKGLPIDRQKRIEYNRKLNQWKSDNTERRFVSDYYNLFDKLSLETVLAKETYDLQIRDLLLLVTNSKNQIEFEKLSPEQFEKLEQLESERKGLANLYDSEGNKKEGTDLQIALELRDLYEELKGKLESTKFTKKFQELRDYKKKTLSKEQYDKWLSRATSIEYDKKFYEELEALDSYYYGEEYEELKEEKNELLKRYRNSELEINASLISPEVHKRVYDIEVRMDEIRKADKSKKPKSRFEEIASVEKTQQYYDEIVKQKNLGTASFEKWTKENHIGGKPISIWTQIVPVNDDYILTVPKRYWAETSEESPWYNKNFNEEWRGMQPKSKWNNPEYNKLNDKEKDNLKELLAIKNQGDDLYKVGSRSYYLLPQISKSTMDIFTSDNKWSNFKELVSDSFVDKVEDDEFGEVETRADGSQIKYIPRFYTKQLDNPDFISDDLIRTVLKYRGAAEKYKQMSNNAPELELVMEAVGERRYVSKRKALSGKETTAYKVLQSFIDHHVYSIQQEPLGHFRLFGKEINTSKLLNRLEGYVRNKNLVFNLFTTITAYTTASVNTKIEDLVGTYTDNKSKLFAEKEYDKNAIEMLSETDKAVKQNRLSLVMERLGLTEDPFNDLDKSRLTRLASSTPYASYGLVSHRIKTKLALAMLSHYRVYKGKLIKEKDVNKEIWDTLPNTYDLFKIEGNKATLPEEYRDLLVELQLKIEFVANRIDGALGQTDKAAAHRHAFMQLLTTHRGWLFSGVQNRFKKKGMNEITGEYEEGYYRSWFNFLGATIMRPNRMRMLKNMIAQWETLEDYEKIAVQRTLYELAFAVAIGIVAVMLNGMADDDDDWDFAAYIANRTLLEASVFPSVAGIITAPVATIEASSILNSPIAASNVLEQLSDLMYLFSTEEVERGAFEGMTKGEKALLKLTPGIKGAWTSRDAESANQFIKMKSLRWLY